MIWVISKNFQESIQHVFLLNQNLVTLPFFLNTFPTSKFRQSQGNSFGTNGFEGGGVQ